MVFIAPSLLVLAGFVGLAPFDMNMLFIALPALAAAVALAVVGHGALRDLLLPHPVLSADERGIYDRRVMPGPLEWGRVGRVTSIVSGGGGVVLDLAGETPVLGLGTLVFEAPDDGAAHIQVRNMTVPAGEIARMLLHLASQAGVETGEARAHDKVRRRNWLM